MVSPGGDSTFHASAGPDNGRGAFLTLAALVCLVWYAIVISVSLLGYTQLWRYYSAPAPKSTSSSSADAPTVTIIRPVKGLEPNLYDCLASTFRQNYAQLKLRIFFCISEPNDPSLAILQQLLADFPSFDAHILVETEDALLQSRNLGPNPKIRNMSRAYREAAGDIVWIIDCNVWVGHGALGRMVDTLTGTPAKFVHLLPLVVDVTPSPGLTSPANSTTALLQPSNQPPVKALGGRLEESFMSSSHAKFYTAINTVLLAPCIVGKSTMFRRSHLDSLTQGQGIDFFARNICEDHLIGDLLWRKKVPPHPSGKPWQNHALVWGDLAVQPMAGMSVKEYIARRVRWLRVRKFTVPVATLVEPGTESFLCSIYGAFVARTFGWIGPSFWSALAFWFVNVALWCLTDYTLYRMLQSGRSIEVDEHTPGFCRPRRRGAGEWFVAWLGREALAFPVWAWAVYGGVTVVWRGKRFWVGWDMMVHEVKDRRCD